MSLVKVWTEIGSDGKCCSLPAKILTKKGNGTFIIKYLSVTDRKTREGKKIYTYEDETYEVSDDYITEYLESDSELDFGFEQLSSSDGDFVKYESDSDDDYVPSSSEDDDDDSESVSDSECDDDEDCESDVEFSSGEYDE